LKSKILFFAFILFSFSSYSQSKNTVSAVFGVSGNDVSIHGSIGDFGYKSKSGTLFGFTYSRNFNSSISLETGVLVSDNKTEETFIIPGMGRGNAYGTVKMITIPVFIKYSFLKYLYLDGGPLIDKQTNYTNNSTLNDQSGIGFELGIGGKYSFNKFTVFINPSLREHDVIAFAGKGSSFNLLEAGVKLGLGYNF